MTKDAASTCLKQDENERCAESVVLDALGEIGRWQWLVLGLMTLVKSLLLVALSAIVYLAAPQPFRCAYGPQNSTCLADGEPCTRWVHTRNTFTETVVTEWDLVCDKKNLASWVQTSFMFAVLLGSFACSGLADKLGRKKVLITTGIVIGIAGPCAAIVSSFWAFLSFRFIEGLAVGGSIALCQVLCVEILGPKSRAKYALIVNIVNFAVLALCAGLAYLTSHWRIYQFTTTIPSLISLSFIWILPESPRWLIAVGRTEEALKVLQSAAKMNNNPVPEFLPSKKMIQNEDEPKAKDYWILDLVKIKQIRTRTFVMVVNFLTMGYCHYGIQQYVGHIKGNIFINSFVAAVFAIGGVFITIYLLNRFGRKVPQCAGQLTVAGAFVIILFLPDLPFTVWIRVCLAGCGMVGTSVCFSTGFIYCSELYPTVIRSTAVGNINAFTRIGAMLAPFAVALNDRTPRLPPLLFGSFSLVAGLLVFLLPETKDCPLPATFEQMEESERKDADTTVI